MNHHMEINMTTVIKLGMEDEVNVTLDIGIFHKLFGIKRTYFWELSLKFLSTITIDADVRDTLLSKIKF